MANGPGPPVKTLFLTKNESVESDQGQPPRSPVICPPLPVLETMMDDERENLHREVGEPQVAFAVEQGIEEK